MTETSPNRVAMISGANRGIGAEIARHLIERGWTVSAGVRSPDSLHLPSPHTVHTFDASRKGEADWVGATLAAHGRIDAIIANAGVMVPGSILECSEDDLDLMFDVNLRSPIRLVREAWTALEAAGSGRVVVVASLSGKRVKSARSSSYALTKHAAVALVHAIKRTGWDAGIRATAVCPGFVATDMSLVAGGRDPDKMTQPADVARLITEVLDLPNTANIAELCISCAEEDMF